MGTKTFSEMYAEAENKDSYWSEVAILDFTSELWQLMNSQNITKRELAERIGTSPAYITKIFQGNANFTIDSMVKLTRALGGNLHIHVAREEAAVRWLDNFDGRSESIEPSHETIATAVPKKDKPVPDWTKRNTEKLYIDEEIGNAAA